MIKAKIPSGPTKMDIRSQKRQIKKVSMDNEKYWNEENSDFSKIDPLTTFHNYQLLTTMSSKVAEECIEDVLKTEGLWDDDYKLEVNLLTHNEHGEDEHGHVCYEYIIKDKGDAPTLVGLAYGPTEEWPEEPNTETEVLELDVEISIVWDEKLRKNLAFKAFGLE